MVSTMMSLAFAVRFLITAEGSGIPTCSTVSSKCHRSLVRSHSSHNGISSTGQQSENLRGHNGQRSLTSRKVRVAMSPVIWALPCAGNAPPVRFHESGKLGAGPKWQRQWKHMEV